MNNYKMILGYIIWNLGKRESARMPFFYRPSFEF